MTQLGNWQFATVASGWNARVKVGLVKFMAVVDPTNQSRRAVAIVVGVTVAIADAAPVFVTVLRVVRGALLSTRAVKARLTILIRMASDHSFTNFTDVFVCTKRSFRTIPVRETTLAAVR